MAACIQCVTAAGYEAPTVKLKRRKTTAAAQAANSIPAAGPSNTAAQPAVANPTGDAVAADVHRKASKRKRDQAAATETDKESEHAAQPVHGNAPAPAGDAPIQAADAATLPQNALSQDGTAPAASQGTSAEVHTQSRQARRKQLRRRLKREGILPLQKKSDPNVAKTPVTSALEAAAAASAFDPNALQPHQGQLPAHVTASVTKPPPAKRLKTHAAVTQPLNAQQISKGHVYFGDSSDASDADQADDSSAAAAQQNGVTTAVINNDPRPHEPSVSGTALAEAKQAAKLSVQQKDGVAAKKGRQVGASHFMQAYLDITRGEGLDHK